MGGFLFGLDKAVFTFFNRTCANPLFDAVMPVLTDLNKSWAGLSLFAAAWLALLVFGGRRGAVVALLLALVVAAGDQLSSSVLKGLVERPRPCHDAGGVPFVESVRLLVPCGSGWAFPSSHAVNNFAAATLLAFSYRRWSWAFFGFATLIAFTRVYVGVHYPSDVLGGAAVGVVCAGVLIAGWRRLAARLPLLEIGPAPLAGRKG